MAAPTLNSDTTLATAGYFQLYWEGDHGGTFELQQAAQPNFADTITRHIGPDSTSAISGLADGEYYYRVRESSKPSEWSETLKVDVLHHSLNKAWMFFSLGALMFLLIIIALILGNRSQR